MKLGLGTVQFGLPYGIANQQPQTSFDEVQKIIDCAGVYNIDLLDTAVGYGDSEKVLGLIGVGDFKLVTKVNHVPEEEYCNIYEWICKTVRESLITLNTKNIYGLLLHRPLDLLGNNGDQLYQALLNIKNDKIVDKIGISVHNPDEIGILYEKFDFDIIQAPFNLFDRRLYNSGWMDRISKDGKELHVRSIFLQGILLQEWKDLPKKFHRWSELWIKYDNWLIEREITKLEACLGFVSSFHEINYGLVGVNNMGHLIDILGAKNNSKLCVPDDIQSYDTDLLDPLAWLKI